jgi:hypothetical protein
MKYIITESRLNNIVIKWLNDNYGELRGMENPHGTIYYKNKDGNTMFKYNPDYGITSIEDSELQNTLINMFDVSPDSLNKVFTPWFNETYDIDSDNTQYTTWHCNKCGQYHHTKHHIE